MLISVLHAALNQSCCPRSLAWPGLGLEDPRGHHLEVLASALDIKSLITRLSVTSIKDLVRFRAEKNGDIHV